MAAATGTYIFMPQSMVRIMEDASEEVGGVIVLSKMPLNPSSPNVGVLQVKRAEIVAGEPGRVDPSELLSNHEQDPQWVLFHTHPPRTLNPQYMGLSYGDMGWILSSALTANGESPKVSHLLFSDSDIHYTIVPPVPYKKVRDMLQAYVADRARVRVPPGVALDEFIFGMRFLFYIAETWIRLESSEGRADGSDTTALSLLNAIWFTPDDRVTAYMLVDYERNTARYAGFSDGSITPVPPFIQWFSSHLSADVRTATNLDQLAIADINRLRAGDASASGLLYTWSMPKAEFLAGGGVMYLNDNGYVYINFVDEGAVQYNFQQAILDAVGGGRTPSGGSVATADMKTVPGPPRLMKGGGIPSVDVLRSVAAAATADMEKGLMKDVPPEEHNPPPPPDAPQSNPPPKLGITFAVEQGAPPTAGRRRVPKTGGRRKTKRRVTRRKKATKVLLNDQ
jgi:hypothetical protein